MLWGGPARKIASLICARVRKRELSLTENRVSRRSQERHSDTCKIFSVSEKIASETTISSQCSAAEVAAHARRPFTTITIANVLSSSSAHKLSENSKTITSALSTASFEYR